MSTVQSAISAYRSGRFRQAQRLLDGSTCVASELLLIRIATRLNDASAALTRASALRRVPHLSVNERIEAELLEAVLLVRTGEIDRAERGIQNAKNTLNSTSSAGLESELFYVEALVYFAKRNYAQSEKAAWNAVHADLDLGSTYANQYAAYVAPVATTKARALQLIGLIRASQERYHEHHRILREAITLLRTSPFEDVYVTSNLYMIRAYYARDFGIVSDIVEFELLPYSSWPNDLSEVRVEIDRSLAYLYSLAGDNEAVQRSLRRVRSTTGSEIKRLSSISDEAFLARHREEPGILRAQLTSAIERADLIDWESSDFERYALADFARELVFVDPAKAFDYIRRFDSLTSNINPLVLIDRRSKADDDYSIATVLRAGGETERATRLLLDCFETWTSIGFRWRATLAAIDLSTLVGSKHYIDYALRESQHFPNSWLRTSALAVAEGANDHIAT